MSSPSPNPGARILVVDDERAMRVALRDILDSEGYRRKPPPMAKPACNS